MGCFTDYNELGFWSRFATSVGFTMFTAREHGSVLSHGFVQNQLPVVNPSAAGTTESASHETI